MKQLSRLFSRPCIPPYCVVRRLNSPLFALLTPCRTGAGTTEKLGADVRPFCNIINAERRHQAALFKLMDKYQIEVPVNGYLTGDKPLDAVPNTLQEACAIGVAAEIENARLYDEDLLPSVSAHEDITRVFTALSNASIQNHLPAFERCADRGGQGHGHGKRRGLKMADENQDKAN